MFGLVQSHPLLLPTTLAHAAATFPEVEVVSHAADGETRTTWAEVDARARRLGAALGRIGTGKGGMAGSLAWSSHRHLELFHGVPGVGAVLHTANPRLAPGQRAAAIRLCGYETLFVDPETIPLAEAILKEAPNLRRFVVLAASGPLPEHALPEVLFYEDLIAAGREDFVWPDLDERQASTLCFTSGTTTGEPKGVLYSHRGTLLNAMISASPNALGLSAKDAALAISPFFHCNGWGLPYLAPLAGAKLVLPGRDLSVARLQALIEGEGVTFTGGVPTIWLDMIAHCRANGLGLGRLERVLCGGSPPSAQLIETLWREFGVRTVHAWGMTETTHGVTFTPPLPDPDWPPDPAHGYTQGRPIYGAALRAAGEDGAALPKGDPRTGRLQIRAHWAAAEYFRRPDIALSTPDGWMETGDVGVVTARNEMRILDRDKDAIKSGGEWISSQALENAAAGFPGVAAVAVIAVPDPRWGEGPLALVERAGEAGGAGLSAAARLAGFRGGF
ncbi:MAG: AMP-binding protein, partial [Alphaproteobacteria bacterium]